MRNLLLAGVLLATGCSATDQPCYTEIPIEQLPQDVLQKIKAGFPAAAFDRAEEVSAQAGPGYRVQFHDQGGNYWIEFDHRRTK